MSIWDEGVTGVPVRSSGLVLLAVVGSTVALTSCASIGAGLAGDGSQSALTSGASTAASAAANAPASTGTSSTGTTTTANGVPAGYHRVGGAAQGMSLAMPSAWVSINLAKESLDSAAKKLAVPGMDSAVVEQDMQSLQKDHALFAFDVASSTSDPNHYTRNLNAYCVVSGINDTGSAGIPYLKQAIQSELSTIASDVTETNITIGGVPGLETSYKLNSTTGMDVRGAQLEVLPKPNKACFVTLSRSGTQSAGDYLAVAAATAQFP
jgi:hypothetical protein